LKNAGRSGRLIVKDAVFLSTGPPRPIQILESLPQTLTSTIPSTFPDLASIRGSVIGVQYLIFQFDLSLLVCFI
jgi:hypothetical protein